MLLKSQVLDRSLPTLYTVPLWMLTQIPVNRKSCIFQGVQGSRSGLSLRVFPGQEQHEPIRHFCRRKRPLRGPGGQQSVRLENRISSRRHAKI